MCRSPVRHDLIVYAGLDHMVRLGCHWTAIEVEFTDSRVFEVQDLIVQFIASLIDELVDMDVPAILVPLFLFHCELIRWYIDYPVNDV